MPDTARFYAAELVDSTYLKKLPFYEVDTSTPESLRACVEAIVKAKHPEEHIKGMLAVVKAKAGDSFTEEEQASLFDGVTESDGAPYAIEVADENRELVYVALDQMKESASREEAVEPPAAIVDEESAKRITELETELTSVKENLAVAEELLSASDMSESLGVLQSKVDELTAVTQEQKTAIDTQVQRIADLTAKLHESTAQEAARLAAELGKPLAKDKSFEELVALFAARTEESLADTIADYRLESEAIEEPEKADLRVADPTIIEHNDRPGEKGAGDPSVDVQTVSEQLYPSITQEDEEVFLIGGLTQEELDEIKKRNAS